MIDKNELDNWIRSEEGADWLGQKMAKLKENRNSILDEKKRLKSEYDLLQEKYSSLESSWMQEKEERRTNALETGISDALSNARIDPNGFDDVRAILEKKGQFTLDDESGIISIGESPIDEYIKDWQQSESGKRYTLAAYNTGGGAKGSDNGGAVSSNSLEGMSTKEILNNLNKFTQ